MGRIAQGRGCGSDATWQLFPCRHEDMRTIQMPGKARLPRNLVPTNDIVLERLLDDGSINVSCLT
jgi:hypothetical protein